MSFLVLLSTGSRAQSGKKFSAGLKVGANFSRLDKLSYQAPRLGQDGLPMMSGGQVVYDFFQQNDARSTGLVGGVYARFGRVVYLQPEVLFSVKSGRFDIIRQGLSNRSIDVKVGTVDIPLLLGVRLGPLRINAGPMASLPVLSGNLKKSFHEYTTQPFSETANQAQLNYQAGIGLSLAGLQLDLRHEGGLRTLAKAVSMAPAGSTTARMNLWQLTVGFGF